MADAKITALDANTAPLSTDLLVMVDDPGGTPATQKITFANAMPLAAIGTYLVGPDKTQSGQGAYAIDIQTGRADGNDVAGGDYSIVIGFNAAVHYDGTKNIVIGYTAEATPALSIAIGSGAQVAGAYAGIAIGSNAYANSGMAIGDAAQSSEDAIAIGGSSQATTSGLAFGPSAYANQGVAIGGSAHADKLGTVAIGLTAYATYAQKDISIGYQAATDATYAIMLGVAAYNVKMKRDGTLSMMDWKVRRAATEAELVQTHHISIDLNGYTYYVLLSDGSTY